MELLETLWILSVIWILPDILLVTFVFTESDVSDFTESNKNFIMLMPVFNVLTMLYMLWQMLLDSRPAVYKHG